MIILEHLWRGKKLAVKFESVVSILGDWEDNVVLRETMRLGEMHLEEEI